MESSTLLGPLEEVQWLMFGLSKDLNRVHISLPTPEDGNRSSFRNVMFPTCLEFRTIGNVRKPIDFEVLYTTVRTV
jgi:hypothetical protein